jgi:hypothetical protein
MVQTDIADHNHLGTAGMTRNQMHSGVGDCEAFGQVAQELLVGRSIHRSGCQSDAYQVSVETRNLSVRGSGQNLQPDAGPAGHFMNRRWW